MSFPRIRTIDLVIARLLSPPVDHQLLTLQIVFWNLPKSFVSGDNEKKFPRKRSMVLPVARQDHRILY